MRTHQAHDSRRPQLRLWSGGDAELAGELTVRRLFDEWYKPLVLALADSDPKTIVAYAESVGWWERLAPEQRVRTITARHMADFAAELAKQPGRRNKEPGGISAYTRKKHLRQLATLLAWAGPGGKEDRDGEVFLERPPRVKLPRVPKGGTKRPYSLEEWDRLVRAVDVARLSAPVLAGVDTRAWWRAILITAYHDALREGSLFDLRFAWLRGREWHIPPEALKGGHDELVLPIDDDSLAAIESIRTDRELVFEWPHCDRWFDTLFESVQRAAGILPADHWGLKLHGGRKLHRAEFKRANGKSRDELELARQSLGHEPGSRVTDEFYLPAEVANEALAAAKRRNRRLPSVAARRAPKIKPRPPVARQQWLAFMRGALQLPLFD